MTDQHCTNWAHSGLHPVAVAELEQWPLAEDLVLTIRSQTEADVLRLGHAHPADWLIATRAPIDCLGLIVIASGVVRSLDHFDTSGVSATSSLGSTAVGRNVVAVQEVGIDGSARFWIGSRHGQTLLAREGGWGLVPDAMRRALQLPTEPPEDAAGWYWAAVWMRDVLSLDPGTGAREVARWHPAVDPREVEDLADSELTEFVVRRHLDHALMVGWPSIRTSAIDGWLDLGLCAPEVAAWHDDGSFSRALTDQLPSLGELADAAAVLLGSSGWSVVDAVMAATRRHG